MSAPTPQYPLAHTTRKRAPEQYEDLSLNVLKSLMEGYNLYNEDIEGFFLRNFIYHGVYHRRDRFANQGIIGIDSVLYIHRGRFGIYSSNPAGQEIFLGYIPQYSTMNTFRSSQVTGKHMIAATDISFYLATQADYLSFLQSSPELIRHQIEEGYYRRNVFDFPRNETLFYPAQIKVYEYVLYLVTVFGDKSCANSRTLFMQYPPTVKDIASYLGIHRSHASRYINELKSDGLIELTPKVLRVLDAPRLSERIAALKMEID